jgi:AcrR family transcriptional regulator
MSAASPDPIGGGPLAEESNKVLVRPARGTRPANRRELILRAASELFYRDGYANVAMKDIAEAVNIGPSALYRHFRNKHDLLLAVVSDALVTMDKLVDDVRDDPTTELAESIALAMLEHRAVGVLWHREARHLSDAARTQLRHKLRTTGAGLADLLMRQRPELTSEQTDFLAWAVLGVATSVSFHRLEVPADRFIRLLAEMITSVIRSDIPPLGPVRPSQDGVGNKWTPSRGEAILATAIKLFAQRGFASVGIEDIGAGVGIAGPSIYHHFSGKAEILSEAMMRGNGMLRAEMHRELSRAVDPADALDRLMASYTTFALENVDLIRLLRSDLDELHPDQRERARTAQRDYITEWTHLLRQIHPDWDAVNARIRVHALLIMINDIAATPHLHAFANIEDVAILIGKNLLRTENGGRT